MSECKEPSDRYNIAPEWIRISSLVISHSGSVPRVENTIYTVRTADYVREFSSMIDIVEDLGISYGALKNHLYRRRKGLDPVTTLESGLVCRIYDGKK